MSHDTHENHDQHQEHESEYNFFDGGGVAGFGWLYVIALLGIITWLMIWG